MNCSPGDGKASGVGGASMIATTSASGSQNGTLTPFGSVLRGTGSLAGAAQAAARPRTAPARTDRSGRLVAIVRNIHDL